MLIPYGKQTVTEEDINAVEKVLRSPFLTQGDVVPSFEKAIANKVGASHSVSLNSATSALHVACLALGLGPGDIAWTSPITFVASANCAIYCGAKIDFVDIDANTGLMSVNALEKKLFYANKNNQLPKIIITVHLGGTSCDMESINRLANLYDIKIIEDASHAIGGKFKNEFVGSCAYSSICIFSFHPVKIITTGEGGIATTNDPELLKRMRLFRNHGINRDFEEFQYLSPGPWGYEQQVLGFNYRLSDIHASLGLSQLQRLDSIVIERNRLLSRYKNKLVVQPLSFLEIPQDVDSSVHLAICRLDNKDKLFHQLIFRGLHESGVLAQVHYTPVHLHPFFRDLGFFDGDFPIAESYSSNAISLPLYPGLTEKEQNYVIETLVELLQKDGIN